MVEHRRRYSRWLLIALAALVFALGIYFWWELKRSEERQIGETVRAAGRILDRQLMEELDRRIAALRRLSESFTIRAERPAQEWEQEASAIARDYPGLLAIGWINPKGEVAWAAPAQVAASVEKLHELIAEDWPEFIAEAAAKTEPSVSRVVEVANQGRVFPVYVPVVVDGKHNGMLMGSLHLQFLFESIFNKILDRSYGVALLDGYEELFSRGTPPSRPVEWESNTTVSLYGWNWRLRLWLEPEQWAAARSPLPEVALLSTTLVSAAILALLLIPAPHREPAAPVAPAEAKESPGWARKERARHQVWEAALASVDDAVIVLEPEVVPEGGLLVQFANRAFRELTGWPANQIRGRTLRSVFDASDLREQTQQLRIATQEPQATQLDLRLKRADGANFQARLALRPVPDESGHVGHWIGVLREQNREAVERSESSAADEAAARRRALAALFDSSSLAVVGCDGEARVQLWNGAAEALFGWPVGEAIGQQQNALPAGAFLSGMREPRTVAARRRDGSACEIMLWSATLPATVDPGLRWLFFCAASGAPGQESTESQVLGLRRLLESAADLLLLVTGQGTIEFVSPQTAQLLGTPAQELLGRPLAAYLEPGDQDPFRGALQRFSTADPTHAAEPIRVRLQTQDGRRNPVELSGVAEPGGELLLLCGRDLGAAEQMGEKQAQAEAARLRAEAERTRIEAERDELERESARRRETFAAEEQRLREAQRAAALAAAAAQERLAAAEQEQAAAREKVRAAQLASEQQAGAAHALIESARAKAREELERAAAEWRAIEVRQQEAAQQVQAEAERMAQLRQEAEQLREQQAAETEALRAERSRLTEVAARAAQEEQRLAAARVEALALQKNLADDAARIEATRREALALMESQNAERELLREEQERLAEEAERVAATRARALTLQAEQAAQADELGSEQRRVAAEHSARLEILRAEEQRLREEARKIETARDEVEALRRSQSEELHSLRAEQERLAAEDVRVTAAREQALALLGEQTAQADAMRAEQQRAAAANAARVRALHAEEQRLREEARGLEAVRSDVEALRQSQSAEREALQAEQARLAGQWAEAEALRAERQRLAEEQESRLASLRAEQERLREEAQQLEGARAHSKALQAEQEAQAGTLRAERQRLEEEMSRVEALLAAPSQQTSDVEAARGIVVAFALRESEERYRLAAQSTRDGIWDWDLAADTIYYSPRWKQMLGFEESDLAAAPEEWLWLIHPTDLAGFQALLDAHLRGHTREFEAEYRVRNKQGGYVWMGARGQAVRDESGRPLRIVGSQTDLSEQKAMEEQLIREAFHDALTQLPNRALFLDRLGVLLDRLRPPRTQQKEAAHFAVLFLDLDRFKDINDTMGHLTGDKLLVEMGRRLSACVGPEDTVARHGGDEFTVLLGRAATEEEVNEAAARLLNTARRPLLFEGIEIHQSVSIGSTRSALGYERPEDMLRDADTALYEAKRRGRDTHVPFTTEMLEAARSRFRIETELRHAMERGEFALLYQPIYRLLGHGTQLDGMEALLRWNHPRLGTATPGDFLTAAEESGLLGDIDAWVLREACGQMKQWHAGGGAPAGAYVSVNLSAAAMRRPEFAPSIRALLSEAGLAPERLHLEISERNLRAAPEAAKALRELQREGIALHLDDFGSGQSSIELLSLLRWERIKLDRRLVTESRDRAVLETVLTLARRLGLRIAAEGVESESEAALLRELGCEYAQGFRYAAPLARAEAGRLLAAHA